MGPDETPAPEPSQAVGVRFQPAGKVYYFDGAGIDLAKGDTVVVETARGVEAAEVVLVGRVLAGDAVSQPLRPLVRKATAEDLAQLAENREKEKEALRICAEKVAEHGLEMDLVDADYTFDRAKLIFYFTAEGRVDFRQLVRDLSGVFKTRIELRQIGVRDEAKMLGGLGPCGRQLCCRTFLSEFRPVSIRMAKRQDLSLNPSKISGLCGRLMCCLRYEDDHYPEAKTAAEGGGAATGAAEGGPTGDGAERDVSAGEGAEQSGSAETSREDRPAETSGEDRPAGPGRKGGGRNGGSESGADRDHG